MPPKNKKQKELVQDERFQAIVLTDSFETRFMPLTSVTPRCLLPLANVPLIEYTLEFLAKAGVNEVYLMCSAHAEQIQKYVEQLKWAHSGAFTVTTIMNLELRSVGDAMRDLDNRGVICGDFLLVSGDVVTNIDFGRVMQFHRAKRAQDKDHIATMVLSSASPFHRTRSQVDPAVFVLDKASDRCHYYQGIPAARGKKGAVAIDPELLEDIGDELVLRNDLIDCHVDICTPHVPQIFQENFDYQTLRGDFVRGVLTLDLLKKTIYAYITAEYAARVELWATYAAVSQDVLARWSYPLVPDSNLVASSYGYESHHVYKEDKVVLAQLCTVGNSTCIGAGTRVGAHSAVAKSIIGRNCRIGAHVTITNSYVWDNAVIDDHAVVDHAIVAADAHVGARASLAPGCVVGYGVAVGCGKTIARGMRVVERPVVRAREFGSDDDSASDADELDTDLVGDDGRGVLYALEADDDSGLESNSRSLSMLYQLRGLTMSDELIASVSKRKAKRSSRRRRMSSTSVMSTDYYSEDDDEDFNKEAIATVERAIENNHDLDTALLELNTLRMSMNVTYHEVRLATVQAMVRRVVHFVSTATLGAREATAKVFGEWGPLFRRQVFSDDEQVDLAQVLQEACAHLDSGPVVLFVALRQLYELDVVEEESILRWWELPALTARPELEAVRTLTQQFVEWLRDAEEEDSDDE